MGNKVIKILIAADITIMGAWGFVTPVFAIFLVESIEGGSPRLAGMAIAIYWLTESILKPPISYYLDKKRGLKDDFYAMIIGFSIYSISHFLYIFAKIPYDIYAIQFFMGIGAAFAFPPWYAFFSKSLDKNYENFEWGIEASIIGFSIAGAGLAAGFITENFGFTPLFIISGVLASIGTATLLFMRKHIRMSSKSGIIIKD